MKQRLVGKSGLRVSRLGLGTSTWGSETPQSSAQEILQRFVEAGGLLIDTSPSYSGGSSEEILGSLLSGTNPAVNRDHVVLSGSAGVNPTRPLGQRVDCSRRTLVSQLDQTLATLGTDHLDLWSVGYWDGRTPPEEVADTLDYAVRTGRVRYAGVRGYSGWQLAVTHAASALNGAAARPVISAQSEYNLLVRSAEQELLPATQHLGVGFFAGASIAQGVLSGKYRTGIPINSRAASPYRNAEVQSYFDQRTAKIVEALVTAAEGLTASPVATALAWTRDRPGVTSAVVGARDVTQLDELLSSEELVLPHAIAQALDDISI